VVLHVLEAFAGGTSRHLVDLVRHTSGVQHIVAVPNHRVGAVPDHLALPALEQAGANMHMVEMRRMPLHPVNCLATAQLTRLVNAVQPDVIHGHSAIGGALARVVPAPRRVRRVYTPNGLNQNRHALRIERQLVGRTDRLVAVSASEGQLLRDLGLADDSRLTVIPNAVEVNQPGTDIDLRAMLGLAPGTPLVGTVARLLPQKAPERFVECCKVVARQRPDVHFVLIGDGPLAPTVDALAAAPELSGRFTRLNELQGAAPALPQLDVFVLLSRFEGGPYAPLEAMRGGTPSVLSDAVGNIDVLGPDLSGLLVPKGDPAHAAEVVLRLLGNELYRELMSLTAKSRVAEDFDVRAMGRTYTRFYTELSSGGSQPVQRTRRAMASRRKRTIDLVSYEEGAAVTRP
jgi:glycosyltransferase involved in cell wall biosynthesis